MIEAKYECPYCHKQYVREDAYLKHKCKQMIRADEIKTVTGQVAYSHYGKWMKLNRRKTPNIEVFTTSRFYTAFIKFVEYAKRVSIVDVDVFIQLMVERDLSPTLWTNDRVYVLYLEYLDRRIGPIRHATNTINTFFKIADAAGCSVSDIFDAIHPGEVTQLIRQRRLSPWLLLHSKRFMLAFSKYSPEQRSVIEDLIRPVFWKLRFQKHPETVTIMKRYIEELEM